MYRTRVLLLVVLVMVFSSCVRNKNGMPVQNTIPVNTKVFEVSEVIQGGSYTYLNVKENQNNRWVAVSSQEINPGDVYYYDDALQMNNFHSKELDRDFEVIYFVNQISKTPLNQNPMGGVVPGAGGMPAHSGKVETEESYDISIEKSGDEITIAQVFEKRADYSGKEIEIRGVVAKVNNSVMGKNWIHIQDGTNNNGDFDLTITSQDVAEVGDEVTFKGKITLDKDFGSGYFYDVILEDATLTNKSGKSIEL